MNVFIRTTNTTDLQSLRILLWRKVYCKLDEMLKFLDKLEESFMNTVNIEFDPIRMQIVISSKGRDFNMENDIDVIKNEYQTFITSMYMKSIIDQESYDSLTNNISRLFFITYPSKNMMIVNL